MSRDDMYFRMEQREKYLHDVVPLVHLAAPYEPSRIRELRARRVAKNIVIEMLIQEFYEIDKELNEAIQEYINAKGLKDVNAFERTGE